MRGLWTIISVLALANLLAMGAFIGWLGASGRLSPARIDQVRAVFAPTVAQEQKEQTESEAKAAAEQAEAAEAARVGALPMPADERTGTLEELEAIANMRVARAEGETRRMMDTLALSWEELKRERARFEAERASFEEMRTRLAATEGSEQFAKAVALYESVGPESAQAMLRELISRDGAVPGQNTEQAVAYLNAMKQRTAAKVIQLFQDEDPALAADLLDRVRGYGMLTRSDGAPTGDASTQSPPKPSSLLPDSTGGAGR